MSDEIDDENPEEGEEEGEGEESAPSAAGFSSKQIILFVFLPLVLICGIGAGLYFSGVLGGDREVAAVGEGNGLDSEQAGPRNSVFYELPELLVNLNTTGRRASFLKLKVSLELGSEDDIEKLEAVMPRVVDNFQVYLRELRVEDLRGSAGIHRLREELLARVKVAAQPAVIHDILFKEMLVQ